MKFMLIRRADANTEKGIMPSEEMLNAMAQYNERMQRAGVFLTGDGLRPSSEGYRITFTDGAPTVSRGPFNETGVIAGYSVLQVDSAEEAIEWARQWPVLDNNGNVALELRPLVVSLNSFNGFMTLADGRRLFFKTHTEPDNVIGEYYHASALAQAGYPVLQPIYSSTEAGKQLLVYEVIHDPSVFDVAWQIETGDATQLAALEPARVLEDAAESGTSLGDGVARLLDEARDDGERLFRKMIALQEELDWRCYEFYGLLDDGAAPLAAGLDDVPEVQLGERPFEIVMARKIAAGELATTWFERHGSTPITEIRPHGASAVRFCPSAASSARPRCTCTELARIASMRANSCWPPCARITSPSRRPR